MSAKQKIILIGGAPTIGKTQIAKKLSKKLSIPWISTDVIRSIVKAVADKKKHKFLFYSDGYTAEKYLKKYTPKQIVAQQNKESVEVWRGVRALIKKDYCWYSFIVEGVAILPNLVYQSFKNDKKVKPVFLINNDREQIRKVVYRRGLWSDASTYSDSVKETEVEWAYLHNQWFKKQAKRYKYPIYDIDHNKVSIDKVIKLLK